MSGSPKQALLAAAIVFASGCATQRQTGKALQVTGTAAVVAGAIVASQATCGRPMPDERYSSVYAASDDCRPNGSRQAAGAAVAAAGMGTAALGTAIENDANRLDAWKRSRSSSTQPLPAQGGARNSSSLLALPEAPFTPRKPAPAQKAEEGTSDPSAGDSGGTVETDPTVPAEAEEAPAE